MPFLDFIYGTLEDHKNLKEKRLLYEKELHKNFKTIENKYVTYSYAFAHFWRI